MVVMFDSTLMTQPAFQNSFIERHFLPILMMKHDGRIFITKQAMQSGFTTHVSFSKMTKR